MKKFLKMGVVFLVMTGAAAFLEAQEPSFYGQGEWGFQADLDQVSLGLDPLPEFLLGLRLMEGLNLSFSSRDTLDWEPGFVSGSLPLRQSSFIPVQYGKLWAPFSDSTMVIPLSSLFQISLRGSLALPLFEAYEVGLEGGSLYSYDDTDTWAGEPLNGQSTAFGAKAWLDLHGSAGVLNFALKSFYAGQILTTLATQSPGFGVQLELGLWEKEVPLRLLLGGTLQQRQYIDRVDALGGALGLRLFDPGFDLAGWREGEHRRALHFEDGEKFVPGATVLTRWRRLTDWLTTTYPVEYLQDLHLSGFWPWLWEGVGVFQTGISSEVTALGQDTSRWGHRFFVEFKGLGAAVLYAAVQTEGSTESFQTESLWSSLGASVELLGPDLLLKFRWDSQNWVGLETGEKDILGRLSVSLAYFFDSFEAKEGL